MYAHKLKVKLGEILVQIAKLSLGQLKEALLEQTKQSPSREIGAILIDKGFIEKDDVESALSIQQGHPYLALAYYKIEPRVFKKIPIDLMWKYSFVPLDIVGDFLTIAVFSLINKANLLAELKNYKVKIFISTHKEIKEVLGRYSG